VMPRGYSAIYEKEYQRKNGTVFPIELRTILIRNQSGKPLGMWAIVRDVTERKAAAMHLEMTVALLSAIVNSPSDIIIFSLDKNYQYTFFNNNHRDEMRKVWFVEIKTGDSILDYMTIPELRRLAKASMDRVLGGEAFSEEQHQPNLDFYYELSWNPVLLDGVVSGLTCFIRDITARRRAENENRKLQEWLHQSQKLEAIGQLASGIAHDFNNALGAIMGNVEVIRKQAPPGAPLLKNAATILTYCESAAHLTRQLLSFARKSPINFGKIEVNGFMKGIVDLIRRTMNRDIKIDTSLQEQPCFIVADRNLLENAILNIAINARDAMPSGGRLGISSETVILDGNELMAGDGRVTGGRYVKVSVTDTGIGMSREIQNRIFEPFFTTKEVGKGTGLGLAGVYGCVKQHGGYIRVESAEGKGSRFDLFFPLDASPQAGDLKIKTLEMIRTGQ
jgi:signal transduction histidine kinase